LQQLDDKIAEELEKSATIIEKNKLESLQKIHTEIYGITKLTLSKISSIPINDNEIKEVVDSLNQKVIH
jgi:hypothetical protein